MEVGGEFGLDLRQIIFFDGTTLGTEAESIILHLEETNCVALPGEGFVEDENAGFHPGVGIETAGREGDDGDEGIFDEHFPQLFVGTLALEDDALGDDDGGTARGSEMLGHVVHEEDFAALGLDRKSFVGLDASFRGHERRIGENDIREFVPPLLGRERVVFVDVGIGEAVEVEIHQREAHHVRRDVVAFDVLCEKAMLVRRQGIGHKRHRRNKFLFCVFCAFCGHFFSAFSENGFIRRNQKPGGATSGIEDDFAFFWSHHLDHEIDDVARGAELPGVPLRAEDGEQILEGIAEAFAVVVGEFVDDFEKCLERFGVAIREVGVLKDVPEQRRDAGVLRHFGDALGVERKGLMPAESRPQELGPTVAGEVAGEKRPRAAEFLRPGIHVVHELVDKGDGDLLDLGFWIGDLADEDVAGGVDAALGVGVEHGSGVGHRRHRRRKKEGRHEARIGHRRHRRRKKEGRHEARIGHKRHRNKKGGEHEAEVGRRGRGNHKFPFVSFVHFVANDLKSVQRMNFLNWMIGAPKLMRSA